MTDDDVQVHHREDRRRYEITVAGEVAGSAAYEDGDGRRTFTHTEVDERFAGRGLGSRLVAAALADTRDAGRRVVAECPFVAAWLRHHPEFDTGAPGSSAPESS